MGKTIALPEDKTTRVEAGAQKLLTVDTTTQENLECFVGTLISTTPAVWQGPLHYRALQTALIISLNIVKITQRVSRSLIHLYGKVFVGGLPGI